MTWNNASVTCNWDSPPNTIVGQGGLGLDTETINKTVKVWKDFEKMNALIRLMCIWRAKVVWTILLAWESS